MQLRLPTVDTQDKLTRLEQRSLNTRPTHKLPTMPSEYVLFCGLHFIKMSNDKDILPANTQEQERELWLSSSFRLWAPDFVHNRRMLKTVHFIFYSVSQKTAQRSDKTAHQSIMACTRTISTTSTIYFYLLLSTTIYSTYTCSPWWALSQASIRLK